MAPARPCSSRVLLWLTIFFSATIDMFLVHSTRHGLEPPAVTRMTELFPHLTFTKGFREVFGGGNVQVVNNGSGVNLVMTKLSGSGFASNDKYHYGFFSAAIKLPSTYCAGVVVAFYMSNSELYPHNHDEIDFELLGHEKQKDWILQTNMYGNGSVGTGREEKFRLWFDPSEEAHHYSILWNSEHIVFLVDDIPVREVKRSTVGSAYPSKPMSLYATIWDGSQWATHGGQKPVNYKFAPFVASFADMEAVGCSAGTNATTGTADSCGSKSSSAQGQQQSQPADPVDGPSFTTLSEQQRAGMDWARDRFMVYSYCRDLGRYKVPPPECVRGSNGSGTSDAGQTTSTSTAGVTGMFRFGKFFVVRH